MLRRSAWLRHGALWLKAWPLGKFDGRVLGTKLTNAELGQLGEWMAARWLRWKGRRVLARNFSGFNRGEVDIVARHEDVLTFVEVKTRSGTAFGRPADAVGPEKQRLIQRGALDWLRELGNPKIKFRFDIVEVILVPGEQPKLNVIENAFQLPDNSLAGR